ncbi:TRAP transporter small permease subunit [Limnobacter sp.]|uniref:TRAP transporter small permease subunit n=1 Tax=Limnobacter sp. TaxID=2003368 RepID=UPI003516C2ED
MKQAIQALEWIVEGLGGLARLCVLALVLLVATNVILRYFFSIGPVALQELEWHLVSPIALFGLAYAMKHKADVRVDFIYDKFGPLGRGYIDVVAALLTFAVAAYIAWLAVPYVLQAYDIMEGSPDPGGLPYRYMLKAFIPLGFALLMAQALANLLHAIVQIQTARAAS